MSDIITVKNISKSYGKVNAVKNVSLEVNNGEFLAIQGQSGSGKTTLLNLMTGLEKPSDGEVIVNGKLLNNMSEDELALFRRHNVGIVFQFFNLIPTLNVIENIALPLFPEKMGKKEMFSRAEKVAGVVGLSHRLTHYPNELSGGEQQRVAIARALINEPGIVFADEPTGNLDSKSGKKIIELLKDLNKKQNLTIIMITHDDAMARESGRTIKMSDGAIKNE
jgi:putative ABC transport system ATP-binding protein